MFKLDWVRHWGSFSIKLDRRTNDVFMYRDSAYEFRGYPVPVYLFENGTLGM